MSFQEVDLANFFFFFFFFECYKAIENFQSAGYWYSRCGQCSGCQTIQSLIRQKKRYCCICQFQDDYHLLKLSEIKRDIVKLRKNYSNIMKDLCEIKKIISTEENFWERDIHYVLNNNGLRFYINEMKDFLFQL